MLELRPARVPGHRDRAHRDDGGRGRTVPNRRRRVARRVVLVPVVLRLAVPQSENAPCELVEQARAEVELKARRRYSCSP